MRIGVDVDNCVVDMIPLWLNWLNKLTGLDRTLHDVGYDYSLGELYREELEPLGVCPMDFWRYEGIYDTSDPISDSVRVLEYLAEEEGHEVIFISKVMGNHGESKKRFLNAHFPFHSGIVFTENKGLVNVDVMIDDRNAFLNQFNDNVKKILFWSPYTQCEEIDELTIKANNWVAVGNIILEEKVFK